MPLQKCGSIRKKTYSKSSSIKKTEVLRILKVIMENQTTQTGSNATASMQAIDATSNIEGAAAATNIKPDNYNDFFNTGRIGRRNALPDILSIACATTSTADLSDKFNALTTTDVVMTTSSNQAASGSNEVIASTSSNICSSSSSNYNDNNVNPT